MEELNATMEEMNAAMENKNNFSITTSFNQNPASPVIGPGGIFLFYQCLENNDRQGLALAWPRDQGPLPHAERQLAGLAKARPYNQPQPGSNMPIAISNNYQSAYYGP